MKKSSGMVNFLVGLIAVSWIVFITIVYYLQYMEKILGFLKR